MEKLAILASIFAIPAIFFMLVAKINGDNKWIGWIFLKLPSLISLVIVILMTFVYFGLVKVQ